MRKVVYSFSVSLDGYIEGANGDLEWSFPGEELHRHFNKMEREVDAAFYGRRLYENMAAFWPSADENPSATPEEIEYAGIWKSMPKIVFSKTLERVDWNSELLRGGIAEKVTEMKAQPGKDMSVGGASLASAFINLGLVDEFRLYVHPVILGSGKPMFRGVECKIALRLLENKTFDSGVVLLRYERAG